MTVIRLWKIGYGHKSWVPAGEKCMAGKIIVGVRVIRKWTWMLRWWQSHVVLSDVNTCIVGILNDFRRIIDWIKTLQNNKTQKLTFPPCFETNSSQKMNEIPIIYSPKAKTSLCGYGTCSKILNTKVSDKMAYRYANSADPDQTSPSGKFLSEFTLFAILPSILRNNYMYITRIPRKASSHLLAQKSQEPQSECGY